MSYGIRMPTYAFDDADMLGAIDRLLADTELRRRMAATSTRLQANPGTTRAADLIEGVAAGAV
jgi:UDP:flavonoid glycosyltransferase YjiC (YdhE family)